jgi:hypothetical protein
MTSVLKDNVGGGPPLILLPTGEQQIVVSIGKFVFSMIVWFFNIKVACRIRPMTEDEILQGATIIAHKVADDNVSIIFILTKKSIG